MDEPDHTEPESVSAPRNEDHPSPDEATEKLTTENSKSELEKDVAVKPDATTELLETVPDKEETDVVDVPRIEESPEQLVEEKKRNFRSTRARRGRRT